MESVGFGEPSEELSEITIDQSNIEGTTNRTFKGFHRLVNLENIYATVDVIDMQDDDFNNHLEQLRSDAARSILSKVFNQNKSYQSDFDYSDKISSNLSALIDAFGYQVAYDAIEQMMVTKRANIEERNAKLSISSLKMELEGAINNDGKVIAKGIERKLNDAITNAYLIFFPKAMPGIENANCW